MVATSNRKQSSVASVVTNYYKEASKMNKTFQSIRYSATGVFGYEIFDEDGAMICQNSSVLMPDAPLRLSGFGYELSSCLCFLNKNAYQTIDDLEGRTIAYIQFKGPNIYFLKFYNMEMEIVTDATSYNFYVDNSLIVSIFKNRQPYTENGLYYDKEKMFDITVWTELEPAVLLVVFNIPSLIMQ